MSAGQSPTGTITFRLYGPDATPNDYTDNCSGTPVYTDTVNVDSGNYFYNSDDFTPTSVGTYYWIASYSGDSNNQAATDSCSSGVEVVRHEVVTHEETTSILEEGELASPPDSTLSYDGSVVRVSVSASFCWSTAGGSMCADGVSTLPPRKQTLHVPSGSEMVFRYEAPRPPKEVRVSARSFDEGLFMGEPAGSSRSLKAHGSGVERTIPAELPPGKYGVYVYVTDPQGDPYYLFRVMVQ